MVKQPINMTSLFALFMAFFMMSHSAASNANAIPEIPQIPAFLPNAASVPQTKQYPIDGEWMINDIGKRIRIERGRAYAVDPWVHLFVLKIQPLMVVSKDWRRVGKGQYTGEDLPLMGKFNATLTPDGNMNVSIAGALGPVNLTFSPVRMDNQSKFDRERGAGGRSDDDYTDEDEYSEEDYRDEDEYSDDAEDNYRDDENDDYDYEDDGSEGDEYYDEKDDYYDEEEYEEEYEEEAAPKKVKAKKYKKAKRGCEGKQVYRSGTKCYACPEGYKRTSVTRKMTHPEACKERGVGFGKDKVKAKYVWGANGCPKHQFKYKGYCMKYPKGTKRIHVAGIDTGYCKVL